jgi:hypothetical protein
MGEVVAVIAGPGVVAVAVALDPLAAFAFPSPWADALDETSTIKTSEVNDTNKNFCIAIFPSAYIPE